MLLSRCPHLQAFLNDYSQVPEVASLARRFAQLGEAAPQIVVPLYRHVLALQEQLLWRGGVTTEKLASYQAMHRELEELRSRCADGGHFTFMVTIPVADRPRQLRQCLESLLLLCRTFGYGGRQEGGFRRVKVIIADDSRDPASIQEHKALAEMFSGKGLSTKHFDQSAQLAEVRMQSARRAAVLARVIGVPDEARFAHKGASRMRNIALLHLNRLADELDNPLFFFIDSDQEFRILADGQELVAVSYFHQLERIFANPDIVMLSGKVVGDPPVSPAVMAGNLLDDVSHFLLQMARLDRPQSCSFHSQAAGAKGAAYHDMADLFGFAPPDAAYDYACTLSADHDHAACFNDFASKLARFFDGEHPTRVTVYEHQDLLASVQPARTVYTGNYLFRPAGLKYFIPFADLKLRMAGPTLGRIVQAELGAGFVSANLPLLHKRTLAAEGRSEFRSGVERLGQGVDLAGEFERQFFGDVMLFSIEALTRSGYPATTPSKGEIETVVEQTLCRLRSQYAQKQQQILERLERLKLVFQEEWNWWNRSPDCSPGREAFAGFIANMECNFGADSRGYALVDDPDHRQQRNRQLVEAIARYGQERQAWVQMLELSRFD